MHLLTHTCTQFVYEKFVSKIVYKITLHPGGNLSQYCSYVVGQQYRFLQNTLLVTYCRPKHLFSQRNEKRNQSSDNICPYSYPRTFLRPRLEFTWIKWII